MSYAQAATGLWLPSRPAIIRARTFGEDEFRKLFRGDWWAEFRAGITVAMAHIYSPGLDSPFAPGTLQGRPYIQGGTGKPSAEIFAATTSFTVPVGVSLLYCKCYGAGGGGALQASQGNTVWSGAGGGYSAGYFIVSPGQSIPITIGAPGANVQGPGGGGTGSGGAGGTSSILRLSSTGGGGGAPSGTGTTGGIGSGSADQGFFSSSGANGGSSAGGNSGTDENGFFVAGASGTGSDAATTGVPGRPGAGGGGLGSGNAGGTSSGAGGSGLVVVVYAK